MKKKALVIINVFALMSANAIASTSNQSQIKVKKPVSASSNQESKLSGDFGIWSNTLVDDVGEVPGNEHYGDFNIQYESTSGRSDDQTIKKFSFASRMNNEQKLMYSVKEAIYEKRTTDSRFAFGRTTLDWSHTDREWSLGHINNRVNFDYFNPDEEGLVGGFYDKKFKNGFKIGVFASMIYVPELNPGYEIDKDNGTVECKNPWCTAPSASTDIEGNETPIYYNVNYPEISDVAFKASTGLKLGKEFVLSEKKGKRITLNTDVYALKKPENNISVSAEIKYENKNKRIFVDATPQVFYHDITGANIDLDFEAYDLKLFASAISITPEDNPEGGELLYEYTGIKPRKIKEEYISTGAVYATEKIKIQTGYIARVSEFDKKNDILVEYPRWNQALHLAVDKPITRKFSVSLDYKYDMLTEDRLTMFNTNYRFGRSVLASAGVNIIGTDPEQESFWSDYENNDSVYTSLKYTF